MPESCYPLGEKRTACLSGAAKLARRQHGEKKNAIRASAVEHWSTALRGPSAVAVFAHFFFLFFYTKLTCTERGPGAVENLGSLRH